MEAIHLAQEAIITEQREEIEALKSSVIEYQETISNLKKYILILKLESTTTMHTENNHE